MFGEFLIEKVFMNFRISCTLIYSHLYTGPLASGFKTLKERRDMCWITGATIFASISEF